jgi:hypothetical protein
LITTHPHGEAARQYLAGTGQPTQVVVIEAEDLNSYSGPNLAVLFNRLTDDEKKHVSKFATKQDGQRRVFAALNAKYGQQPEEPFDPKPTATDQQDTNPAAINAGPSEGTDQPTEGQMATKSKKSKKPAVKKSAKKAGERKPRVAAPLFEELSTSAPKANMTCGCYIRSLLMKGGKNATTAAILDLVKKHYPDSSAKASDVSWNRQKLRNDGKKLPAAE